MTQRQIDEAMRPYAANDFFQSMSAREQEIVALRDIIDPMSPTDPEVSLDVSLGVHSWPMILQHNNLCGFPSLVAVDVTSN